MEAAAAAGDSQPPARVLLVGVDDSADSSNAFDFAVEHLLRPGDELHLVHVIPRLQFASMYGENREREKKGVTECACLRVRVCWRAPSVR